MLNVILYPLLLICLLMVYALIPQSMNKTAITFFLVISFGVLVLFGVRKETFPQLKKQYLKHSILFLFGYIIVHFQYPLDFVLGNVSERNFFIWMNHAIVVKSLYYSTIGLISFLWGYSMFHKNRNKLLTNSIVQIHSVSTTYLLLTAAALLFIYFVTANPLYLMGYYGTVSMGTTATYTILLFKVMIFATIIQNTRNMILKDIIPSNFKDYIKHQGYYLFLLIAVYLLSVMISGDRGPIITFSIAYLSGYYVLTKKKFSLSMIAVFAVAASFFITTLGITRSLNKDLSFIDRVKESTSMSQIGEQSILPQTTELASSIRTFHAVVDYVPDQHPHTWGRFQFQQLVSSIPFSSNIIAFLPDSEQYRFNSPASFATWIIQGETPTSGAGTTCLADLYEEFGLFGIIIGMFVLGKFIRFSEVNYFTSVLPLFPYILSFVYLSDAIYLSRSSILMGFKTVVWIYVVLLINKHIVKKK